MIEWFIARAREALSDLAWGTLKLVGWFVFLAIDLAIIVAFFFNPILTLQWVIGASVAFMVACFAVVFFVELWLAKRENG